MSSQKGSQHYQTKRRGISGSSKHEKKTSPKLNGRAVIASICRQFILPTCLCYLFSFQQLYNEDMPLYGWRKWLFNTFFKTFGLYQLMDSGVRTESSGIPSLFFSQVTNFSCRLDAISAEKWAYILYRGGTWTCFLCGELVSDCMAQGYFNDSKNR